MKSALLCVVYTVSLERGNTTACLFLERDTGRYVIGCGFPCWRSYSHLAFQIRTRPSVSVTVYDRKQVRAPHVSCNSSLAVIVGLYDNKTDLNR